MESKWTLEGARWQLKEGICWIWFGDTPAGGSRGPEDSGLPGDVWQHLGDVQMLNKPVYFSSTKASLLHQQSSRSAWVSFCVIVCFLLQLWALFIILFIYLVVQQMAKLQSAVNTFSLWSSSSEGPTRLRSPAITSNLAAAEIDPPRKASWC